MIGHGLCVLNPSAPKVKLQLMKSLNFINQIVSESLYKYPDQSLGLVNERLIPFPKTKPHSVRNNIRLLLCNVDQAWAKSPGDVWF